MFHFQIDTFVFEAVSLQELRKLVIGHDGQGHGAGWFLDKVIVKELEGENSGKEFIFPCNRWLDDQEDDGKTERELKLLGNFCQSFTVNVNFIVSWYFVYFMRQRNVASV